MTRFHLTSGRRRVSLGLLPVLVLSPLLVLPAAALDPSAYADPAFQRTWERTDRPVEAGQVARTWVWGAPVTGALDEPYVESPEQSRLVQYFDKTRMEITDPNGDPSSIWYVTNGLLVVELMTGLQQNGNNDFGLVGPAEVNVAGDPLDPDAVTYADLTPLTVAPAGADGAAITQRVDENGVVTNDPDLASHAITAAHRLTVPGIDHQIASVFWDYMHATGLVYENGGYTTANLFPDPYYATGYPKTEPYWTNVDVGGADTLVLLQCFERRCLTYTPTNAPEWRVEMGNVGLHYHTWRYTPPPPIEGEVLYVGFLHQTDLAAAPAAPRRDPNSTPAPTGSTTIRYSSDEIKFYVDIDVENAGDVTGYEIIYNEFGDARQYPLQNKYIFEKSFDEGTSTLGEVSDSFLPENVKINDRIVSPEEFRNMVKSGRISIVVKTTQYPHGSLFGKLERDPDDGAVFGASLFSIAIGASVVQTSFHYDPGTDTIDYTFFSVVPGPQEAGLTYDNQDGESFTVNLASPVQLVPTSGQITGQHLVGGSVAQLAQQMYGGDVKVFLTADVEGGDSEGTTFAIDPSYQQAMWFSVMNPVNGAAVGRGTGVVRWQGPDAFDLLVTSADLSGVNGLQLNVAKPGQEERTLLNVSIAPTNGEVNGVLGQWTINPNQFGKTDERLAYLANARLLNMRQTTENHPTGAIGGEVQFPYGLEPVALYIVSLTNPDINAAVTMMAFHANNQPTWGGEAITGDAYCGGGGLLQNVRIVGTINRELLAELYAVNPDDMQNGSGFCGLFPLTLNGEGTSEPWQGRFELWSPDGWKNNKVTLVATVIYEGEEIELSGTPDILWESGEVYLPG